MGRRRNKKRDCHRDQDHSLLQMRADFLKVYPRPGFSIAKASGSLKVTSLLKVDDTMFFMCVSTGEELCHPLSPNCTQEIRLRLHQSWEKTTRLALKTVDPHVSGMHYVERKRHS